MNPCEEPEDIKIGKDRYRVLIEDVADGFYETDLRGNFKFFNNALCRIFGYSRAEIQDRNFREFMDEKNAGIAFAHFNRMYRTGEESIGITWEIIRKNGETGILEISANLIFDEKGEKIGFRGISRDITEKYKTQEALKAAGECTHLLYQTSRQAERRYRALLDFFPDPVFVFNSEGTVAYLNPAFEKIFGWTLKELKDKHIPFVPDDLKQETRDGTRRLFREKAVRNFETKRLTKDGRVLDIVLEGAIFYEEEQNEPSGQVVILRDITREKQITRTNQSLFRIARALYQFRRLDERLEFIIKEVRELIRAEGASVILLDEEKKEFFIPAATYDDAKAGDKMKEIRFPADKGVAGYVYRTGQPLIVPDTSKCSFFFQQVDEKAEYQTRNMADVPIRTRERMIGVLCAVNKKDGDFDQQDVELLSTIANTVALPIENAGINEKLRRSYEEVRSLNRAKERVIHHLSHELKTPLSVLDASLSLLYRKISDPDAGSRKRILDRARRNLNRILDMQYEIEDILREKDYRTHRMLSILLDNCADALEVLFETEFENSSTEIGFQKIAERIRSRTAELFGPRESVSQKIQPDRFIAECVRSLEPKFARRQCDFRFQISDSEFPISPVFIPPDALSKITEGLIRNAVENTPDRGRIEVTVRGAQKGPVFEVRDFGIGITKENQRIMFESIFSARDTKQYSSRTPYDFNAGGKGFDLLRMKIFSERYHFRIYANSQRCRFIPRDEDICPGAVENCSHCRTAEDCFHSGGTAVTVQFPLYCEQLKIEN